MTNSTKSTTCSARKVRQKPAIESPQSTQPASRKEIIDFFEHIVDKASPELSERYRSKLSEQLAAIKKDLTQPSVQPPGQQTLHVITRPEQVDQLNAESICLPLPLS